MAQFSNFLSRNWFPPAEASLKRACIKKLIYEILEDHSQKASTTDYVHKFPYSLAPDMIKDEMGVEYFDERCHSNICHGTSFSLNAQEGVQTSLPVASSPTEAPYTEPILGLKLLLEQGAVARTSDANPQLMAASQKRGSQSPIKDVEETTASLPLNVEAAHQVPVLASDVPSTLYSSDGFRAQETSQQGFSMHLGGQIE